jgi:CRISPR-associated endoribonuclease Cas6
MRSLYQVKALFAPEGPIAFTSFTGTMAESLVLRLLKAGGADSESLHNAAVKPFSVTPFFVDGRPVTARAAVEPGKPLWLRVSFADEGLAKAFLDGFTKGASLFGVALRPLEAEVTTLDYGALPPGWRDDAQCFKLEFLTPVRFATPSLYPRRAPVFEFVPRPLALFRSAIKHGRDLGVTKLGAPFLKWVYTYVAMTDFGCKGKCVVTVPLTGGRVARGFLGWALYRAFSRRRLKSMWRALSLMALFNVGTGKPMGLGVVDVKQLDCPQRPPKGS